MAIIKKFSPFQNLSSFQVFLNDTAPNSRYFKITELNETLTGGKNGFLIEGSEFLKESTEVKIEILDVENTPIYYEPGNGVPEYYEGISKLVSVHVYDDTPIGTGKITILGELKNYIDENGAVVPVPDEWKGIYNVKWERTFQINKNLNNETIVRFYKRPIVNITELVKPIFSKSIPTVTDTGYAHGISETPIDGTDIRNWRAGTLYKLKRTEGSWDRDVDENTITFTSPSFTANIVEVLNDSEVLVDVPYTINNLVSNFTSGSYSVSYADFQNEVIGESTLTGSFAKIDITQLKTFVGDVARVKVFRKSRNSVGDFEFVQESKLESTELLRDITTTSNTEIPYGRFDESNLETYWISSSNDHPLSIDSSNLSQAVKFDYDSVAGGVQRLITSQSLSISKDVEYTLNFRTLLSGSLGDSGKSLRAYFSSSNFTQDFLTASGSAIYRTRQNVSQNILSENSGSAHLVFEVTGDDWYLSNVSLKNAQDTSFSPDEFTLIQDIPRKLASETFDFRFEFYDINNNYIPVDVTAVGVFDGGNDFPTSGKLLTFESDRNAFRFSSGSFQNPTGQQIQFKITQNNLTGSVTFASSAFDVDGNYLDPSDYDVYPGGLTSITPAGGLLTVNNFTGSRTDGNLEPFVGSIVYTASLDSLQEFETVYRLEDGDNAPSLLVTSNANQFTYEPTKLEPKPVGQTITVRAQRKNLASLVTPLTVNSGSNYPGLNYVSTINGIDTYTISATEFSASFSQNSFDEVTYEFTGSDVYGNEQYDEITLSKVVNFDGVSITLSNESTAFRANGQGLVLDDFASGDGEVEVRIADKEISHNNGLSSPNTFDIVSATATNVTEAYSSYLTNEYGVSAMSADSGSLVLNISYLAGDNSTTQSFQKKVNYTKNRIAQPSIIIDTTNKTQNVDAKSTGEQLSPFEDSEITVREFYTGSVTTFASGDVAISFDSNPSTIATDNGDLTLSFDNLADATNSTQVQFTATVTDSEGTSRTVSDSISLSKSLKSAPNVEIQAYPTAQTIEANSIGSGSATPINLTILASEGGTTRTITGIGSITTSGGLSVNTPTSPYTSLSFTSNASSMSLDTGTLRIPVQTTNSEGTAITKNVTVTVTRNRTASPVVVMVQSNDAQSVTKSASGTYGTPNSYGVSVNEGGSNYTYNAATLGPNQFKVTSVSGGTNSTNTISPTKPTTDSGTTTTVTIQYKNSEGVTGTLSKVHQVNVTTDGTIGANGVTILPSLSSQTVIRDLAAGTFSTVSAVSHSVKQGTSTFTAVATSTALTDGTYRIKASPTNCTATANGVITPSQPSAASNPTGLTASYTIQYKDLDGNANEVSLTHEVSVTTNGTTGPGVVMTGVWESGRVYQYADYLEDGDGRRDVVLWSTSGNAPYDTYYAVNRQHTSVSTNTINGSPSQTNSTAWTSLGTQDFFVAAKIGIFEESFVQNTLNVGTNGTGGVNVANITLAGGSDYPYMSIGQSSQAYGNTGIWIGNYNNSGTPSYRASFVGGSNYLKWNGSSLEIAGTINVTGGNAATDDDIETLSLSDMDLQLSSKMIIENGRELRKFGGTNNSWSEQVYTGVGFKDGAYVSFKINTPSSGQRFMMGLNSDPTANANHTSIDYHWYINETSLGVRVNNAGVTPNTSLPTPSANDILSVEYDGDKVRWYVNNTLYHTLDVASGLTLHLDSSFYNNRSVASVKWFDFGQFGQTNSSEKSDGKVGGWTIASDAIYRGTKLADDTFATANGQITIGAGFIGAKQFKINSSGAATFKGALSAPSGNIGGWTINTNDFSSANASGGSSGNFTTAGIRINGTNGWISAKNFYIDQSGNAKFKGAIEGSQISGTSISGGTGDFTGTITTSNISATGGDIGGWTINGDNLDATNMSLAGGSSPSIQVGSSLQIFPGQLSNIGAGTGAFSGNITSQASTTGNVQHTNSSGYTTVTYNYVTGRTYSSPVSVTTAGSGNATFSGDLAIVGGNCGASIPAGASFYTWQAFSQTTDWFSFYGTYRVGIILSTSPTASGITNSQTATTTGGNIVAISYSSAGGIQCAPQADGTSYTVSQGSYTIPFSKICSVAGSTTYYAYTFLDDFSMQINYQGAPTFSWTLRTPTTSNIALTIPITKTELTTGGFQTVHSNTNYFRVALNSSFNNVSTVSALVGGSLEATGNITANTSDRRFKDIHGNIQDALRKIDKLNGILYHSNQLAKDLSIDEERQQVGLIAQELEEVLPEAVTRAPFDNDGTGGSKSGENYLTIWYERVVPLLVEGIKELNKKVSKLENELKLLK